MKKLIPTISMVALGAALLGTSTYAWFSANTQVTASGISMQAEAGDSLLISVDGATTGFSDSATLANDNSSQSGTVYTPVKYTNTSGVIAFQELKASVLKYVDPVTGAIDDSKADYTTSTSYFHDDTWLKYVGEANAKVKFEAKITPPATLNDSIYKAFHIMAVSGGTCYEIDVNAKESWVACSTNIPVDVATSSTSTKVEIYAFVYGPDSDCYNGAALKADIFTVDVRFSIVSE